MVQQFYQTEVNNEYVIRGNAAVLKCSIPSFVADFVQVVSWTDSEGNQYEYAPEQFGKPAGIFKICCFPRMTCDVVAVPEVPVFSPRAPLTPNFFSVVVNQYYEAEVVSEYVIRGNTAVLKCNIPSFVADFVRVEVWVGSDGNEYAHSDNFGNFLQI